MGGERRIEAPCCARVDPHGLDAESDERGLLGDVARTCGVDAGGVGLAVGRLLVRPCMKANTAAPVMTAVTMSPPIGGPITGPMSAGTVSIDIARTSSCLGIVRNSTRRPRSRSTSLNTRQPRPGPLSTRTSRPDPRRCER